jgi:hypothetical protein
MSNYVNSAIIVQTQKAINGMKIKYSPILSYCKVYISRVDSYGSCFKNTVTSESRPTPTLRSYCLHGSTAVRRQRLFENLKILYTTCHIIT